MAEVNTGGGGGGKHEKKRAKKSSTRIDMTPMVDLAFLLLTFFVMTSTFSKPKVMEIPFPKEDPLNKPQKVNNAITFILTKDDGIFYYNGEFYPEGNDKGQPPTKLSKTDWGPEGLHKLLLDRNKRTIDAIKALEEKRQRKEIADTTYQRLAIAEQGRKGDPSRGIPAALTVLIKTDDKAVYKNVVDVIDEVKICNIGIYAVVDMMPKELELLNAINK
ncbi:MAG TPA: biopolymer transporter ExbD [Bacteroidia bacterium]|jgi:biopolymer transport protein ExbD